MRILKIVTTIMLMTRIIKPMVMKMTIMMITLVMTYQESRMQFSLELSSKLGCTFYCSTGIITCAGCCDSEHKKSW